MPELVVVTGTDTGVGKTFVTCQLIRWLRAKGWKAAGLKPIETGWTEAESDARLLAEASGRSLERTIWRHFDLPAAPAVAAQAEGQQVDLAAMLAWIAVQVADTDVCFIEGAGGWLVPFSHDALFRDVAAAIEGRVLVVARGALGTINHSLLTLESVVRVRPVAALVLSVRPDDVPQFAHSNRDQIRRWTASPIHLVPDEIDRLGTQFHVELSRRGS